MKKLLKFLKGEEGAIAMEYGLLAAFIALVIIVAVTNVGTALNTFFQTHIAACIAAW
jgi:pilus assembly protein Flp/PilA